MQVNCSDFEGSRVKALLELAAKDRPEAARVPPGRIVNVTLLRELDDSRFIDRLYR
jgi:hypothetical protein